MSEQHQEQEDCVQLREDNPCWGSPTQCDLKHLLSQFSKEELIIYQTDHYVVLNKPPDLRMDRAYPATVHKLLTYWYPAPSLQVLDPSTLLEAVSKLHQHNSLADNALRPCHQLDYATSGLLCVARTQEAAAHAIRQWEQRCVTKEYLALLEGSIRIPNGSSLPRFSSNHIQSTLQRLEQRYKRSRQPKSTKKLNTFQGFQPPYAMFQKYKATMLIHIPVDETPSSSKSQKRKRQRSEILAPDQWNAIWEPVRNALRGDDDTAVSESESQQHGSPIHVQHLLLQNLDWKQLCRTKLDWKKAFQQAADIHNDLLRTALQQQEEEGGGDEHTVTLPTIFGESTDDTGEPVPNVYYICCPLGQGTYPTDFSMKIPPDSPFLEEYSHMKPFVGSPDLDYKPGLTKCTVMSTSDGDKPTATRTKVRLLPLTGRRHQLRVHMALLVGDGFGILGDATYNQHTLASADRGSSTAATEQRMCLHSHKLALRLIVNDKSAGEGCPNDEMVHLEAPDPF